MTTYKATVTFIYDGDTFIVKDERGNKHTIRLYGIDAPEKKQPFGGVAYHHLSSLILNKTVHIQQFELGKFNRDVCIVYLGQKNINKEMIISGFAKASGKNHQFAKEFFTLQERARLNKIGLWTQETVVDPSSYRKENAGKKSYSEGTKAAYEDIKAYNEKRGILKKLSGLLGSKQNKEKDKLPEAAKEDLSELSSSHFLKYYQEKNNAKKSTNKPKP